MTTHELSVVALPYVRRALKRARPQAAESVGRAAWLLLWPAWAVLTGPLLPLLIRIAIELAIGLASPRLLVFLELLARLLTALPDGMLPEAERALLRDLTVLLRTPRAQMLPPVRDTLMWRDLGGVEVEGGD